MAVMRSVASFSADSTTNEGDVIDYLRKNRSIVRELSVSDILTDQSLSEIGELIVQNNADGNGLNLESLKLPNNRITSSSSTALANIVASTESLKELDLSNNQFRAFGSRLVQVLSDSNCRLEVLNLNNNGLGAPEASRIASIIRLNKSITDLRIGRNKFGKKSAIKAITHSLMTNERIKTIDLSQNGINHIKAAQIAELLDPSPSGKKNVSQIRTLNLASNRLGPKGTRQIVGGFLEGNKHLRSLILTQNNIQAEGAESIAIALKYSYTLEELYLSQNVIGDKGVQYLCQGLREAREISGTVLRVLDLSWNLIHDDGAVLLADFLKGNDTLELLNLECNGIGNKGATALVESFHDNRKLMLLNLIGNQVKDKGAEHIAVILCGERSLHSNPEILLSKNLMTQRGEERIASALRYRVNWRIWLCRFLSQIDKEKSVSVEHRNNRPIGDDELVVISKHLAQSPTRVPRMALTGQGITSRGMKALCRKVLASKRSSIIRLWLRETSIGDAGALELSKALDTHCGSLRLLHLVDCGITKIGAVSLARALSKYKGLSRLNLSGNEFGDEGGSAIISSLLDSKVQSLEALHLSGTGITDISLENLPKFLTLRELYLDCNSITDRGSLDVAKACLGSTSIEQLSFRRTRLSLKGVAAVRLFLPTVHILEYDEEILESF